MKIRVVCRGCCSTAQHSTAHLQSDAVLPLGLVFTPIGEVQHAVAMKHPVVGVSHVPGPRRKGVLPLALHPEDKHSNQSLPVRDSYGFLHFVRLPAVLHVSLVSASYELHRCAGMHGRLISAEWNQQGKWKLMSTSWCFAGAKWVGLSEDTFMYQLLLNFIEDKIVLKSDE